MTREEKARAYDEVMNKIKPLYEQAKRDGNPIWSTYEYLIPELRESDDERIRKFIQNELVCLRASEDNGSDRYNELSSAIAYLEKQKEPLPIPNKFSGLKSLMLQYFQSAANRKDDVEIESDTDLWERKILDYVWKYSDEQKEQKHCWKPTETDVALFNKAVTTNKTLTPTERAQLDIVRSKFGCCNGIVQKEQKPVMIQWTGKNLKKVIDFTGKSPRFDEWFKSWEEFEDYVHSHDDILKLFCEDGSHYEVPVGAWVVKTPDGYNIPSRFRFIQKPADDKDFEDNTVNVEMVADPKTGEKYPFVSYKDQLQKPAEYIKRNSKEWNALLAEQYNKGFWKGRAEQKPVEGDNETEIQKAFREGKSAGRKEVFDYPEEYGLQKPAEWSDEDEKMLNEICANLYALPETREKWQRFLKSLRPQHK